ncbi:MAG: imidazoleglycerol-phosphate dehydratase HisB [Deltaproteobacteria bacterium]|jgi:imidazoleglycerol-phosphate dehydratase
MSEKRRAKNGHTAPEDEPRLPVPVNPPEADGRRATVQRQTKETNVQVVVDLDGTGRHQIDTEVPFFNHMLEAFAHHSMIDLHVLARGDLEVDPHHTVEDVGLCIGRAVLDALGDRAGIRRYGESTRPMDEALVRAYVDYCGRPVFSYRVEVPPGRIGTFDAELAEVFFSAYCAEARMNLHLICEYGTNRHHIVEGCFKTLAAATRMAVEIDPRREGVASTKGSLD